MAMRRSIDDYSADVWRFEEWLRLAHGESISQLKDIDDLIEKLEEWLSSIDVFGSQQGRFAKALLANLLQRSLLPKKRPTEISIIKDFLVDRSGRKWLRSEEKHLRRLYQNPKVSSSYIARELGRSKSSIYTKARRLGVQRPEDAMTDRKWKKMQKV